MSIVGHHNVIGQYIGQIAQGDNIFSVLDTGRGVVAIKGVVWQVTPEELRQALIDELSEIVERYTSFGLDAQDVLNALKISMGEDDE